MKNLNLLTFVFISVLLVGTTACGQFGSKDDASEGDLNQSQEEQDETAALEAIVDSFNDDTASYTEDTLLSDEASASVSVLTNGSPLALFRPGFRCASSNEFDYECECDEDTNTFECEFSFKSCTLSNRFYSTAIAVGTVNSTFTGFAAGSCTDNETLDFRAAFMGDNPMYTVSGEIEWTYGSRTATLTFTRTATHYDAVDDNGDGRADSVYTLGERERDFVVENLFGDTLHEGSVIATGDDLDVLNESGNASIIEINNPIHYRTFDPDENELITHNIEEGSNLIIRHIKGGIGFIMTVTQTVEIDKTVETCGPIAGELSLEGYDLDGEDFLGPNGRNFTISFDDGEATVTDSDGNSVAIEPLPCL